MNQTIFTFFTPKTNLIDYYLLLFSYSSLFKNPIALWDEAISYFKVIGQISRSHRLTKLDETDQIWGFWVFFLEGTAQTLASWSPLELNNRYWSRSVDLQVLMQFWFGEAVQIWDYQELSG